MEENDWVKDHANVYYFSYSTNASHAGWLSGWHYPNLDTNPLIAAFAGVGFMGNSRATAGPSRGWTLFWDSVPWYTAHIDQLRGL
jgi:hypothetical protein